MARSGPANPAKERSALFAELKTHGTILGAFAALLWLIQIVNALVFHGGLAAYGVAPRTIAGLFGILFAPFIHASFAHLVANTIPLVVLGWFVMLRKKRHLLIVSLLSALVGGLGTWLIAPAATVHVGASVLIFGYLGYLLFRGIFERRFWSIIGSIAVFFAYGGALFGVLPGEVGVSWQGHLFGLIGGILAARLLRRPRVPETPEQKRSKSRIRARIDDTLGVPPETEDEDEESVEEATRKRMVGRRD